MSKRSEIVRLADHYIREKGYNAFSFHDISREVGIKTASIHYHFPAKSDLGIAVIREQTDSLTQTIADYESRSPLEKLEKFFSIYERIRTNNQVCLVGSLATDLNTLDERVKTELQAFSLHMLEWVSSFLEEGRKLALFNFHGSSRTKALMIIGNMLAIVQLARLTGDADFIAVKETIRYELITQ